jgi:hypothetical protein
MAVRLSALRAGRPLPPRKIPGTHICYRLSRPQGHSAAGWIRSIEKIHLIGTQTRDLPACSIVPQLTTLPLLVCSYQTIRTAAAWMWHKKRVFRLKPEVCLLPS